LFAHPETEIKQNCRQSAETKPQPSAVLFYFSFILQCATGFTLVGCCYWLLLNWELCQLRRHILLSTTPAKQDGKPLFLGMLLFIFSYFFYFKKLSRRRINGILGTCPHTVFLSPNVFYDFFSALW